MQQTERKFKGQVYFLGTPKAVGVIMMRNPFQVWPKELIVANVAKVGRYSLKVLNSLHHGGPYVAVHIGDRRVAWSFFKTGKCSSYEGVAKGDLKGIESVEEWFSDDDNFNKAANIWNSFRNGVLVTLRVKKKKA